MSGSRRRIDVDEMRRQDEVDRDRLRDLEQKVWSLNFYSDKEEIADILKQLTKERFTNDAWSYEITTLSVNYALQLLNLKQQQKLLEEQNIYNNKQLFWSRILSFGTWALVIATLLLLQWA